MSRAAHDAIGRVLNLESGCPFGNAASRLTRECAADKDAGRAALALRKGDWPALRGVAASTSAAALADATAAAPGSALTNDSAVT